MGTKFETQSLALPQAESTDGLPDQARLKFASWTEDTPGFAEHVAFPNVKIYYLWNL